MKPSFKTAAAIMIFHIAPSFAATLSSDGNTLHIETKPNEHYTLTEDTFNQYEDIDTINVIGDGSVIIDGQDIWDKVSTFTSGGTLPIDPKNTNNGGPAITQSHNGGINNSTPITGTVITPEQLAEKISGEMILLPSEIPGTPFVPLFVPKITDASVVPETYLNLTLALQYSTNMKTWVDTGKEITITQEILAAMSQEYKDNNPHITPAKEETFGIFLPSNVKNAFSRSKLITPQEQALTP